jgi:peptide-methionine (S)-S-oxide reductase
MASPNDSAPASPSIEIATLGGGCFWCMEAVFELIKGVRKVESGYAGGARANPTYEQVCGGDTGHAEVIQVTFDKNILSFEDVLTVFFSTHDPTTLNRQGEDVGTQYRSVIFYQSDEQKRIAEAFIERLKSNADRPLPVVTQVVPLQTFYRAEDYHQGYFRNHPGQGYCRAVIAPKVEKLRKQFKEILAR